MSRPDRYTCEETFRRLDDYLDRALGPAERALVEAHLATCEACASEYRFERGVLDTVRDRLAHLEVPASLKEKMRRALDSAREGER